MKKSGKKLIQLDRNNDGLIQTGSRAPSLTIVQSIFIGGPTEKRV